MTSLDDSEDPLGAAEEEQAQPETMIYVFMAGSHGSGMVTKRATLVPASTTVPVSRLIHVIRNRRQGRVERSGMGEIREVLKVADTGLCSVVQPDASLIQGEVHFLIMRPFSPPIQFTKNETGSNADGPRRSY